jgi:hypothetical protein
MTEAERKKIIFEETYKVLGDEMALGALLALGVAMLGGDPDPKEKLATIKAACEARGVKVGE